MWSETGTGKSFRVTTEREKKMYANVLMPTPLPLQIIIYLASHATFNEVFIAQCLRAKCDN